MTNEEIADKVKQVMAEVMAGVIDLEELTDDARLDELGMASLDFIEIAEALQDLFGDDAVIEDDEFEQIRTVGDFCQLVIRKVQA